MPGFEIVDVEVSPEGEPLFRALKECSVRYPRMRDLRVLVQALDQLTEPPESLQIPTEVRTEQANLLLSAVVSCEGDMAARMLQLDGGQPNPHANWDTLSRSERKRAKRLWAWALDASLDTTPQGRPSKIDPALVLYCARVIVEACGQSQLKFSRPAEGGLPRGPMWRALMAALPSAQSFLACLDVPGGETEPISNHAEAVAHILKAARSKEFHAYCRDLGIGSCAEDVARRPASFRLALAHAQALRAHRK
jgi:hypothetical protein